MKVMENSMVSVYRYSSPLSGGEVIAVLVPVGVRLLSILWSDWSPMPSYTRWASVSVPSAGTVV